MVHSIESPIKLKRCSRAICCKPPGFSEMPSCKTVIELSSKQIERMSSERKVYIERQSSSPFIFAFNMTSPVQQYIGIRCAFSATYRCFHHTLSFILSSFPAKFVPKRSFLKYSPLINPVLPSISRINLSLVKCRYGPCGLYFAYFV